MERSRGIPDEEMFLSKPAPEDCDSPTVEPLRIFKPQSPQPAHAARFSGSSKVQYPARPSSSSPASKLSFPLPPGASSSAAPLPFPDDDDQVRKPTPAKPFGSAYNDTSPRLDTTTSPTGKKQGLAERRGTAPKPISSPTSPDEDQGLFQRPLAEHRPSSSNANYPSYRKTYYPPPGAAVPSASSSNAPAQPPAPDPAPKMNDNRVNRFSSTASNSTTRASRGSPPPPETPVEPGQAPGDGIEARWAASGISGAGTLNSLSAPSAAASQRMAQYGNNPPPQRPWTPTETPDQAPSGPPTVYQGMEAVSSPPAHQTSFSPPPKKSSISQDSSQVQVSVLEQDFQRMSSSSPPPAYSSVNPSGGSSYPVEKQRPQQVTAASTAPVHPAQQVQSPHPIAAQQAQPALSSHPALQPSASTSSTPPKAVPAVAASAGVASVVGTVAAAGLASPALQHPGHPAFANDPLPQKDTKPSPQAIPATPFETQNPASPPPLPEGWIAHLDQNSGQYYYIHLATQATQWEFPKGPNPITHEQAPLSPTASTYGNPLGSPMFGKQSVASPMFPPHTPGYAESIMSVAASATPTTAGFSGPPPSAGVDMYKIQPTNAVYFGPYLRYVNMDVENGIWHGSILIVTDAPQPPTIHIHLSVDLAPNPKQLQPRPIYTHQRWKFYKYDIELKMKEVTERWTYAITSHLGCTRYEFVVAGRQETGWRFIAHSCNDFAAGTSQNERARLGGIGFMWKDVLQKNVECGGFHVQLGLGDQIYGDRLWKEVPLLKQWLAMSGRETKKNVQWTARHEEDVSHAYFHYYTSHFDQPFLREAFAQIPHVLQLDDHDM